MSKWLAMLVVTAGLILVAGAAMADELTCTGVEFNLTFNSAGDAFVFNLHANVTGGIKVKTADCCLAGDIWRSTLSERGANKGGVSKGGSGALFPNFSGNVSKTGIVGQDYVAIISIDNISAVFPAGMTVCIEGPVSITGL